MYTRTYRFRSLAAAVGALLVLVACGSTQSAVAGADDHEVAVMDWAEVEKAVADGAMLVDTRSPDAYAAGHIPGALNAPCSSDSPVDKLPEDKSKLVVFYCGGPACQLSKRGALMARAAGYSKIAEFRGGYPAWRATRAN